jgi:hypothetical protein
VHQRTDMEKLYGRGQGHKPPGGGSPEPRGQKQESGRSIFPSASTRRSRSAANGKPPLRTVSDMAAATASRPFLTVGKSFQKSVIFVDQRWVNRSRGSRSGSGAPRKAPGPPREKNRRPPASCTERPARPNEVP